MKSTGDYYSAKTVKGRRAYRCTFAGCREEIAKGVDHVCIAIGSGGDHFTHRAHLACFELASGQPAPAPARAAAGVPDSARNHAIFSAGP